MAIDSDFASQKSEVSFFMEKTFQISFTYFAGLVAFFALSKTGFMKAVVQVSGLHLGILVALVVLVLNLVYVTLACACLFAILKRGMFILKHGLRLGDSRVSLYIEWEKFVRDDSLMPVSPRLRSLAWNIDNYYMLPLFGLIMASSVGAVWYVQADGTTEAKIIGAVLAFLYVIPAYMLYYMGVLNRECRRLLRGDEPAQASGLRIDGVEVRTDSDADAPVSPETNGSTETTSAAPGT
jgi:hypothetical protein